MLAYFHFAMRHFLQLLHTPPQSCQCAMGLLVFQQFLQVFLLGLFWDAFTVCLFELEVFILFWSLWPWVTSFGVLDIVGLL